MFHLAAFYSNVDQGGVPGFLAGVIDQALTVDGNDVRVPTELPNVGALAYQSGAGTVTEAHLESPSLRTMFYPSVAPQAGTVTNVNPPAISSFIRNPLPLVALEDLNFVSTSDDAGAQDMFGLVWLQDGPLQPVDGQVFTMRATTGITLQNATWVNGPLTFGQVLPVGNYQIVGMRAEGTGLVAARVVVQGYAWRPGVFGRVAVSDVDAMPFRHGQSGVWATFNNNTPPTIDAIGSGGTDQVIYLDLIKVG